MRQKLLSLRQIAVSVLTIGVFLPLHSLNLNAQNSQGDNFVYVMSNKNPGNSIIQFRRASNGSLTWVREVATGGNGSGANGADPLGSQDSLVLGGDGLRLVAVNAGSNEVSVFGTIAGRLTLLSKSSSGGVFPNSVALSGDLVYVLNKNGATPNITGFRLDTSGTLHWIATVPLPPGSAGANDVRFSPDGTRLLLTESGTNEILVFPIASDGVANSPVVQASAGGSPFGIRFGHDGIVVVSEAAGSASSYRSGDGDTLEVISGAVNDTQKASCWISLTRATSYAYLSNTGSGTLSSFQVGSHGELALANAVAANPGGTPIDSSLSRDSRFLYVLDSAQGRVRFFAVDGASLAPLGSVPLPTGIQGIAAQ